MPDLLCPDISLVLFDFGGVLAEEGFLGGLEEIAASHGLEPEAFIRAAIELVYAGYVQGRVSEAQYWQTLRQATGLRAEDAELRDAILERFTLRPWMFAVVDRLVRQGLNVAILSDQTNWLDELNQRHGFYNRFHRVFNSFHTGLSKRSAECFHHALDQMNALPLETLFIDDARRNVALARELGLKTIHFEYEDPREFLVELRGQCPGLEDMELP